MGKLGIGAYLGFAAEERGFLRVVRRATPVLLVLAAWTPLALAAPAQADVGTVSVDPLRTAWDKTEPGLAPSQVSSSDFGQQFSTAVDGQVYAQPIVVGSMVIVVTENNNVYGIESASGAVKWSRNIGPAWPSSAIGCGDLVPNIGITGTPVYDPASGAVYFAGKVNDGPDTLHPHWYVHAVDAATGAERTGWPLMLTGAATNAPAVSFNPYTAMQRPGLLVMGGSVYLAFASHCDHGPYVGFVAGVNIATRSLKLWATEDASSNGKAGIWMSGGGLVSDGPGRILFSTGNGTTPAPGPGTNPPGALSESVVRLAVSGDGSMSAQDFFSPNDAAQLDANDQDLGSGGPVGLPPGFGTSAHPHLLVQVGKDGRIFLLDRDDLGGRGQGSNGGDKILGLSGPYNGVWGHPGVWGGDGGYVYTVENRGFLRASKYGVSGTGLPALSSAGTSTETFGYTSGSPIVTSDGTASGSALVWVIYSDGPTGGNGQLRAYDALPTNGVVRLRWSAPIGTASKFAVPATDSGRVYVGTRDGHLLAFGRPANAALVASPVDFGSIAVGTTGQATLTVRASRTVTITGISVGTPFGVSRPTLPVTLQTGQTLSMPVTYTPTAPGPSSTVLTFTTDVATVGVDLHGTGTQPGFSATPASLDFGDRAVGSSMTMTVNITNTDTKPESISSVGPPAAPFTAAGLPAVGSTISAGASVAVSVTYRPTAAAASASALTVSGPAGSVTVRLAGTGVDGTARLVTSPSTVAFGQVPVGQSVTKSFDISNTGNLALTITKAAPPAAPFTVSNPVAEGQKLNPGDVIHQSVTFSPSTVGAVTGTYQITSDDGNGPQNVTLTASGVAPTGSVTLPAPTGWTLNGAARLSGSDLQLTQAVARTAGSAVFPTPVLSDGLHVKFTAVIGGGTGGDGMTVSLLDAGRASVRSLGASGGGLGYAGLPGVAIALDTYRNGADPSGNFVGVATSGVGSVLTYAAAASNIGNLRTSSHTVDITVTGQTIKVSVDGVLRLSPTIPTLTPTTLLAFTGGTGGFTDIHTVRAARVTARAYAVPPPYSPRWSRNGVAALSGTDLVLTPATASVTGSSWYNAAVPTSRLNATFIASIGGGTGADGMTFTLLNPASALTSIGSGGGGLGYSGLHGIAVTLDTHKNAPDPSANFVGVATSGLGTSLTYAATSTAVGALRTGTHRISVAVTSTSHLVVTVDGAKLIDALVTLPANAILGFTAATGGLTDAHTVRNVVISY